MGVHLTPEQAAAEGLHEQKPKAHLSAQEAAAEGLHAAAPDQRVPDTLTEPGGLSHGPGTSFALNALDSLSMVGLPTTLAAGDALGKGFQPLNALKAALSDQGRDDFRTKFRRAKQGYEGGMERLEKANPKSALAGQLAPLVVPGGAMAKGAKFLPTVARGAATGGATGLLRGSSATLDGDFEGTAKDTGIGLAAGGVLSGAGASAGKVIEAGGNLARKGMAKVLSEVKSRTASDIGKAKNLAGQAAGAIENAWNKRAMDDDAAKALLALRQHHPGARLPNQGVVPGLEHRDPVQVARNLGRRESNADRALDVEERLFKKHGQKLRPPIADLNRKHTAEISREATGHLKGALKGAAMGYAGYKGAEAVGIDPRIGAAIGGAGGLYAVRKISQAAASHPATLKKLMALAPIGRALSRGGAKAAAIPKNVGAVVYALRDHPEVAAVLKEYEDQNGTSP